MIVVTKNVVCPKCGRVVGQRQVEYKNNEKPSWGMSGDIKSDFICTTCRSKMERDILAKSRR